MLLELVVALSALSLGVAGAALALAILAVQKKESHSPAEEESGEEADKSRRQEELLRQGLNNLLHYAPGEGDEV